MCSGSKRKETPVDFTMDDKVQKPNEGFQGSILLELAASDDLIGLNRAVEEEALDLNETSVWYGRGIGLKKIGFEERTPLMIAAMFGSTKVVKYILATGRIDVNRACSSDGATALHCAVAGGSSSSPEIVKLLLDFSADPTSIDSYGNKPIDLIPSILKPDYSSRKKKLEILLKGNSSSDEELDSYDQITKSSTQILKDGSEKKEYPIDPSLPDIKNGIYGTDEFRMYSFKVKPCSRAYSHDWTECPFVHPGENARRRDPRKYLYSCVPCPEFRKGTCRHGDACEYAHGVFESWLHPAQYRTRLCKDETGCARRVCFFAHKPEELRPLYPSTGSGVPSPRASSSPCVTSLDMSSMSPLSLGSSASLLRPTSTPPMSPSSASTLASPRHVPPTLQLPSSRLKTAISARDIDLDMEIMALEGLLHQQKQQQQLMDEISNWNNNLGTLDSSMLSQFQSPKGVQIRQNMNNQNLSSSSSSNVRNSAIYGLDPSSAAAAAVAVMNSRSAAIAKRSQSFIDRGALNSNSLSGFASSPISATAKSSTLSDWGSPDGKLDWGSPDGKLDWGIKGEELNKLRKSASFGFRSSNIGSDAMTQSFVKESYSPWVQSDVPSGRVGRFGLDPQEYHLNSGGFEMMSPLMEQLYMEQEQMVA